MKYTAYRGQHCESKRIRSRMLAISFGTKASAEIYARRPNNTQDIAIKPKVFMAEIEINNPFINDGEDPFVDVSLIDDVFGRTRTIQICLEYANDIMNTNNWEENFSPFQTVEQVICEIPDRIRELCFLAHRLLDNNQIVRELMEKGYDGAIHGGIGVTALETEYKAFGTNQIRVIGANPV